MQGRNGKSLILVVVLRYYDEQTAMKFPSVTVLHLIEEETSLCTVLIHCELLNYNRGW